MKPIEESLDIILKELVKNWDKPNNQRDFLKAEELLRQFGLPSTMEKHSFFRRLIWRLINDGYVETTATLYNEADIPDYERFPIITIEGYYFILNEGGYTQKKANAVYENKRVERVEIEQRANQRWMTWLTVVLTVGTIFPALLAGADLYWTYKWFRFPYWWNVALLNIFLSALTAFAVWKLLQWVQSKKLKQQQEI